MKYFTPAHSQDHTVVHQLTLTGRGEMDKIINEAVSIAQERDQPVQFNCLGVTLTINPDSPVKPLVRDYHRAIEGFIERDIGPYQDETLSHDELARDAEIIAARNKPSA